MIDLKGEKRSRLWSITWVSFHGDERGKGGCLSAYTGFIGETLFYRLLQVGVSISQELKSIISLAILF